MDISDEGGVRVELSRLCHIQPTTKHFTGHGQIIMFYLNADSTANTERFGNPDNFALSGDLYTQFACMTEIST